MKIVTVLLLIVGSSVFAQSLSLDNLDRSTMIRNGVFSDSRANSEIQGSPFINDFYIDAEIINSNNAPVKAKYNAYKDEVEVLKDEKGFIISKIPDYNLIVFTPTKEVLALVRYNDEKGNLIDGYLYKIQINNSMNLFKREKIILEKAKVATSSYDSDSPAKFKKLPAKFFLEIEKDKIVPFPDSKKKIADLFPSKKNIVEDYFKKNKFNFNNQQDIIKFIEALL